MMDPHAASSAFVAVFSFAGLWVLFFWHYREYRVDNFRQRLFAIRDELFDLGRAGVISFDHPAYGIVRTLINGFIRFANRLGVISLLLHGLRVSPAKLKAAGVATFEEQWTSACADLPASAGSSLEMLVVRVHLEVIRHLVLSSLLLAPLFLFGVVWKFGVDSLHAIRSLTLWRWVRRVFLNPLDSAAFVIGSRAAVPVPVPHYSSERRARQVG